MKVMRNLPEQLIVGQNPAVVIAMLIFMALIFAGIGLAIFTLTGDTFGLAFACGGLIPLALMFVFVHRVRLIFEASDDSLTIHRQSLYSKSITVHRLADIDRAETETAHSQGSTKRRVTLIMTGESAGRHPATKMYSNLSNHRGAAEAINAWLAAYRAR